MRKLLRLGVVSGCILLAIAALVLVGAYWGSKQVPEFYERALAAEPQRQAEAGEELERNVLELRNDVRQDGHWQAVFTDEQINGWLAVDLPEKFPRALPKQLKDPRVAIEPDLAQLAALYAGPQYSAVISLAVEIHLTDEPNVLAVRVHRARAGLLPVPLADWLDRVRLGAEQSGIPLRWVEQDGDPVALVSVPLQPRRIRRPPAENRSNRTAARGSLLVGPHAAQRRTRSRAGRPRGAAFAKLLGSRKPRNPALIEL